MKDYQKQNCKGCIHEASHNGCYCIMFRDEPEGYCNKVEYPPPEFNRPTRVPNPPTEPVA